MAPSNEPLKGTNKLAGSWIGFPCRGLLTVSTRIRSPAVEP